MMLKSVHTPLSLRFLLLLSLSWYSSQALKAQLTGVKTIPGNYPSFVAAAAALNAQGVGPGGVRFDIAAGHSESGVKVTLTMASNPPSATRPLVFQKVGAGANPILIAGTGNSNANDGMVTLVGLDYVTFNGIDLQENPANTTSITRMEWGYGLLKPNANNGCQHVTIKNCNITLNKANVQSKGILMANASALNVAFLAVTSIEGTHSYNQFLSNTVQNCYIGYELLGYRNFEAPHDNQDQRNMIGKDTVTQLPSRVLNFGGSTQAAYGIHIDAQNEIRVGETVVNSTGGTTSTGLIHGIFADFGHNVSYEIAYDTVTVVCGGTNVDIAGILATMGGLGKGNTLNVHHNVVQNCSYALASNRKFTAIDARPSCNTVFIDDNKVQGNTVGTSGELVGINAGNASWVSLHIRNNLIANNSNTGNARMTLISAIQGPVVTHVTDNLLYNNTCQGSGSLNGIYVGSWDEVIIERNDVHDNAAGTGGMLGIRAFGYGGFEADKSISFNHIHDLSANGSMVGISVDNCEAMRIEKNNIHQLTDAGSGAQTVTGIVIESNYNLDVKIANNFISQLYATASTHSEAVVGISVQGMYASHFRIDHNTVYLNASSSSTTSFGSVGVRLMSGGWASTLRNNIVVNVSTPGPTSGRTVAIGQSTLYGVTTNYNCLYVGTVSANRWLYSTAGAVSLQGYRDYVMPFEQAAFSELPPFVNVLTPPYDLHLQTNVPTGCESGGSPASPLTDDFDGDARFDHPAAPVGAWIPTACDVGADEFAGTPLDNAPPTILFTPLGRDVVGTSRTLSNWATITDPSGVNATPGLRPRLYYKKSTHANTVRGNTNLTDGWKYVEATNATSPYSFTIDYTRMFGGAVTAGNIIQYFVVAQDLDPSTVVGRNKAAFLAYPSSVALDSTSFPIGTLVNSYTIIASGLSGTINVGPGQAYTSLTSAGGIFNTINGSTLSGDLVLNITGDLVETGTYPLNAWNEIGPGGYRITIQPNAATLRTIAGSCASGGLIRFEGADRVLMDGRFAGNGKYLRIRNTSPISPAIQLQNDARDNTIRNCILESGNFMDSGTDAGVLSIGGSNLVATAQGCDHNSIIYNEVRDRSDLVLRPAIGINLFNAGLHRDAWNDSCVISNNWIHDNWIDGIPNDYGIYVSTGNAGLTIDSNSIYQTATRTCTGTSTAMGGIYLDDAVREPAGKANWIRDNDIGGAAPACGGAPWTMTTLSSQNIRFSGIYTKGDADSTVVSGNRLKRLNVTGPGDMGLGMEDLFVGIAVEEGGALVQGNRIGGATGQDSIVVSTIGIASQVTIKGIHIGSIFSGILNGFKVQDNTIGAITVNALSSGITRVYPILLQLGLNLDTIEISGNLIGSDTTAHSLQITAAPNPAELFGIYIQAANGPLRVQHNRIGHLTNASNVLTSRMIGIALGDSVSAFPEITATDNTIHHLECDTRLPSNPFALTGIGIRNCAGDQIIDRNTIYSLKATNPAATNLVMSGIASDIQLSGGTMRSNKIYDLQNLVTSGAPMIKGISLANGGGWTLANNMISIRNGTQTNAVALQGIADGELNSETQLFNNSIYLGGTGSGSASSVGILRSRNAALSLRNNLVYNHRSGGTGKNYAISNQNIALFDNWVPATSSYNTFIVGNAGQMAEWGTGNAQTFSQWKSTTGGDIESYSDVVATVPADSLFLNASGGDLRIQTGQDECWYVNGKGIAGAVTDFIATDQEGTPRSVTIGTPTDIGADEFVPLVWVLPIPALASAPPALNTTTTYTFAGRKLGEITWGPTGIVPFVVVWSYFASVPPPGALGVNINSYWNVESLGGSGYTYDLKSYYTVHEQNGLADASLTLGRQFGFGPWFYFQGNLGSDAAGKFFRRTGLTDFSKCTLGNNSQGLAYTIMSSVQSGSGTVSPLGAVYVLPADSSVYVITPGPCHFVDSVLVDGIYVGAVTSYTFANVAANHTITVIFGSNTPSPSLAIAANPTTTICGGTPVQFTATSTGGGPLPTFAWFLNGNPVGANDSTYSDSTFADGDIVTCVLTSSDTCAFPTSVTSNAILLSVSQPSPTVSHVGNTLSSQQVWASYQWLLNGTPIPGATADTLLVQTVGVYTLSVTDANGCTGISAPVNVLVISAAPPLSLSGLQLFPNPVARHGNAVAQVTLRSDHPIAGLTILRIYDLRGQQLLERRLQDLQDAVQIELIGFAAGPYLVEAVTEEGEVRRWRMVVGE